MNQDKSLTLTGKTLVFYDGVCALCNGLIQFLLPRDRKDRYRFASLQSQFAQELLSRHKRDATALDTFYVLSNYGLPTEKLHERADGGLFILGQLGGAYALANLFRIIPIRLLNIFYNLIAKNRYKLFGKYETCLLPKAEYASKFVAL